MLVILVDESIKRSWVRSRRIASKYLNQISSNTWIGSLSAEGVRELHEELRGRASKNTAAACYRVRSGYRFSLEWIVGSKANWDEAGVFAFKEVRRLECGEKATKGENGCIDV